MCTIIWTPNMILFLLFDFFLIFVYNELYLVDEVKKCRTKRDPYYQVSPKRVESESDPDTSEENDDSSNGPIFDSNKLCVQWVYFNDCSAVSHTHTHIYY